MVGQINLVGLIADDSIASSFQLVADKDMVDNASLVERQSAVIVPCPVWTINDGSLVTGI